MSAPTLRNSEWALVVSFSLLLLTLILISQFHAASESSRLHRFNRDHPISVKKSCVVTITGAVDHPGPYSTVVGAPLGLVLKKAHPKRFANLREIQNYQEIQGDFSLHIEELSTVSVQVVGAIAEPLLLELPAGTRLCQLKSKITGTPETDWTFFKKKRLLHDQETVSIPCKEIK
ncbi:MAG TPA: hypothetical protein VJK48_03010 [Chlamydiales bacterium]|nr:hypothetical protein [Chlamydiales bacterium]